MISSLFAQIAEPVRRVVHGGRGVGRSTNQISSGGLGGHVNIGVFSNNSRSTIIAAGQAQKMIQMTYQGYTRLVEPYSLEYYVRKRDGVGNEYFWGFDTTGGRSGKTSIKRFFSDQIQGVTITDQGYNPRYDIDF